MPMPVPQGNPVPLHPWHQVLPASVIKHVECMGRLRMTFVAHDCIMPGSHSHWQWQCHPQGNANAWQCCQLTGPGLVCVPKAFVEDILEVHLNHCTFGQYGKPLGHHQATHWLLDEKKQTLHDLSTALGNGKENCKAVLEWVEGATGSRLAASKALKKLKGLGRWTQTRESIIDAKNLEMERWCLCNTRRANVCGQCVCMV